METVVCSNCEHTVPFSGAVAPATCKYCDAPLLGRLEKQGKSGDRPEVTPVAGHPTHHPTQGLLLRYHKTGGEIRIAPTGITILGREAAGHNVFANVTQVSRRHCQIDADGTQYRVKDLGSFNKTFVNKGTGDMEATQHNPISLEHGDILLLGKEALSVLVPEPAPPVHAAKSADPGPLETSPTANAGESQPAETLLECSACQRHISPETVRTRTTSGWTCPGCNAWNRTARR